ncbi:glycerol-3-phosphate 1-O-acyltransferase PlsY [Bacillus pseudomycoides]|uniref:glycerol-3-phosphate 1-O-acyltransferase PlsY n=1 Tax=Bacillus TaxID=1386 RepID=UPI000BEB64E7|nr:MULTISPECIES: glycerol-3-phosphate 1-O-acyltransferase PlsY [Bacillus]MCX2825033.1 glycerol-3-phosphate 1-O-acyltransferase PlsY [Bacillus sp. DHT2]MDR4915233.1 glycerol-3-phosphate 1-O-acyltransferase PlsY [Bacillus pseudomycoides]PDY02323.1 glycerol-3-phosphate 1-O-acyltransferase PlsY [Bacillus pseudomycoides]PEK78828.1 glycerol-3-phosphate 1-O-acyltransferase PlsY [Bacillus pseudomycoides]PEN07184.1 glycerol-3-phosphate 1-O-acyltransferase PlsY [Bacillus pseudomycoides]
MIHINQFLYVIGAYMLGNILTAYMIIKWKYGIDIHDVGSGNPGARNMGRLYGKVYFLATFLGDALKGAIVVYVARILFGESIFLLISLLAVVVGHIYPIFFKYKGGKGISTFIGGLIVFNYLIALTLVLIFILFYLIFKSFTKAGLITIACLPLCMIVYSYSMVAIVLSVCIIILILYAHRK